MKRLFCAILPFLLVLCGCRAEPHVGEQVIVTGVGIDERDGRWRVSLQAVEALRTTGSLSEQSESATAVYTADGHSLADALQGFLTETGKRTYILQNQIIVLSLAQCKAHSLSATLDYFIRNQEGRALVDVVICRGDPAELLDIQSGSDAIPAEYVSQLLDEGGRWGQAVTTRLLDIERTSNGMYDTMVPILEVTDKTPQLSGTALFRNGVLVGELNAQETTGLLLAEGRVQRLLYARGDTTFRLEDIATRLTVEPQGEGWQYRFEVSAVARMIEAEQRTALSERERQALLREAEQAIAADIEFALKQTVLECGSDPLGLARRTAAIYRNRGVTQASVEAVQQNSVFEAKVQLSLTDSGFLSNKKK